MSKILPHIIFWAAIGAVGSVIMISCSAGSKISECQKRGYAQLQKDYGSNPPQEAVNEMTKKCVERYQSK